MAKKRRLGRKRLGRPVKTPRGATGTRAVLKKIGYISSGTQQMKDYYRQNDIAGAFTLKRRTEEVFEKALRECGGKYRGVEACKGLSPAIQGFRDAAYRFNQCRCPPVGLQKKRRKSRK